MSPHKNDVLASNLLFAALLLALSEKLYFVTQTVLHRGYLPMSSLWKDWVLWLLEALAQIILYRAVRRGEQWAKSVVLLASLYYAYIGTQLACGYVAGVVLRHLDGWALLLLLKDLLTLAALVLMFKPQMEVA